MEKVTLGFALVECGRCGISRQTTLACAECGKRPAPTEADVHAQHRQRAVAAAREARTRAGPVLTADALEVFHSADLAGLVDHIFQAARLVARERPGGADRLVAMSEEVALLERWADGCRPRRPLVAVTRHVRGTVGAIAGAFDVVLAALAEEDAGRAQRASDELQVQLDAAASEAGATLAIVQRVERVAADADPVGAWLRETTGGDPGDAIARGEALLTENLGRAWTSAPCVVAALHETVMSAVGDTDRYWELVADHWSRLAAVSPQVIAAATGPDFASRLVEVTEDLWNAARRAAIAPDATSLRAAAGDLLEAGHLVIEQPVKFHAGLACSAISRRTFGGSQAADVSDLVNLLKDKGWLVSSALGDATIRNAFAHRDFSIDHGQVSLSPNRHAERGGSPVLVPHEDLHNSVLEIIEATAAMDLALALVLDDAGVDLDTSALAQVLAPSLFASLGWTGIEIHQPDGARVVVAADVEADVELGVVGFAANAFAGSARQVELDLRRPTTGERAEVLIELETFDTWVRASDGLESEVEMLRLASAMTLNGRPFLRADRVEQVLAFKGCQVLSDQHAPIADIRDRVRHLRALARELGLSDVGRELGRGLRIRLEGEAGLGLDPTELETLLAIARRDASEAPSKLL